MTGLYFPGHVNCIYTFTVLHKMHGAYHHLRWEFGSHQ